MHSTSISGDIGRFSGEEQRILHRLAENVGGMGRADLRIAVCSA